jgi:predicted pyridoxine 5'-phosphate oxidase superfamily flavin-nucleotide-binding protein
MSTTSLPDRIRAFLAEPQPAVIASMRPDGQPSSVATWYLLDGDEVLVNMDGAADWPTCEQIRGSA